nr:MAG TPA: hypothetical protein [Caudoviricetes sp.]
MLIPRCKQTSTMKQPHVKLLILYCRTTLMQKLLPARLLIPRCKQTSTMKQPHVKLLILYCRGLLMQKLNLSLIHRLILNCSRIPQAKFQ